MTMLRIRTCVMSLTLSCARTVVPSHESIAVAFPELAIDILLRLLQSDVHISIHGLQFTCKPSQHESCQFEHIHRRRRHENLPLAPL